MAPLVLEGETLGQKRKHYNQIVNEVFTNKTLNEVSPINFDDQDIDNLLKIDIACKTRNVDYVIDVFKCEDMLYVSRAIKQSKWLINDSQFAYIINPEYLFNELFPQMTSQAKNKLLLEIRLNLSDEQRNEDFCTYLMLQNLQMGFKWLPHCSISYVEATIKKHADDIPKSLMTRLCRRSISFLDFFMKYCKSYHAADVAQATLFLLNENAEKYLDIVGPIKDQYRCTPQFGIKQTQKIMKICPDRILNNFELYANYINIGAFATFLKESEIKKFILTQSNKNARLRRIIKSNIQHFLKRLPIDEKFEFVKMYFINKSHSESGESIDRYSNLTNMSACCSYKAPIITSANIYTWYKFAPFSTAFKEIKKLIKTESNPSERNAMLAILLQCARKDTRNLQSLVQYYRENHINEPFKFKIHFINMLLSKGNVWKYDLKTWGYLNDLFTSMEVYEESGNDVQSCIKCVIIYNLVQNKVIPKIIEDKFVFNTFKTYKDELENESKDKLFNYLYKHETSKLCKLKVASERELMEASILIENILNLLKDWKKNLSDYPMLIEELKKLIITKNNNSWNLEISKFYHINKSWRKFLFNESILLNSTPEVAINALKHNPELINLSKKEVLVIFSNENTQLRRFLNIIRMFWSQSLAVTIKNQCLNELNNKKCYSTATLGLSIMLPQKEFLELVHKYEPTEAKIDWSGQNEREISIRKNLAKRLHLARPQPPLSAALLYAKGDYLQYVLPSLNSLLYNISSLQVRDQLTNLFNAPVSLQKHGIRTSVSKLKHNEVKLIFTDLWNSTKNSSIRSNIIQQTFNLLCQQQNANTIEEIWSLLKTFIDKLTADEDKNIYATLCRVDKVPLSIKSEFWMKSYVLFKGFPEKTNVSSLIAKLKRDIIEVIEFLDPDFICNMYLENFDNNFTKQMCNDLRYLVIYLLSTKDIEIQNMRYNKVLLPIMERAIACWDVEHKGSFYTKSNLKAIFVNMLSEFEDIVLNKDMILPVAMFNNIHEKLNNHLSIRENYQILTFLKLSQSYFKILENILRIKSKDSYKTESQGIPGETNEWKLLHTEAATEFGKICVEKLKSDISIFFPSIYTLLAKALKDIYSDFGSAFQLTLLKSILEYENLIEGYLLVIKLLPKYVYVEDDKSLRLEILNKIKNHPSEEVKMHYWKKESW